MKSGWMTSGPKTQKFEQQFAGKIGAKYSIALNSATAGLHLCLSALELKADEYVITTPYTFNSSASVIRYFNAHPIFVDIDPQTFNIDPEQIKEMLRNHPNVDKIKAMIIVHIAGQTCEMDKILEIAKEYNFKVIEDAAHALPSTFQGENAGCIGDFGVYSFYATKTLCTGEGGMVVCKDEDHYKKIRSQRLHGFTKIAWDRYSSDQEKLWAYDISELGYKYNMTDIAASMGIHQLKKMGVFYEKRKKIAECYDRSFQGLSNVETPYRKDKNDIHSYHLYILQVDAKIRDTFIEELREKKIGTSVHFIPLHLLSYWKDAFNFQPEQFPNALKCFNSAISLPIYTLMTNEQVDYICETVRTISNKL